MNKNSNYPLNNSKRFWELISLNHENHRTVNKIDKQHKNMPKFNTNIAKNEPK